MNAALGTVLNRAMQAYRVGNLFEAEWLCQDVLQQQPGTIAALHLLGVIAYQTGRLDSAIAYYQSVIALNPAHFEAHGNLAVALQERGDLETAAAHFEQSLALNPTHAPTYFNLANLRLKQGQPEPAIAHYQRAIALKPGYVPAYNNLGNALRQLGDLEGAIGQYHHAIRLDPNYVQAYNNLGNLLLQRGEPAAAIAQYEKSLGLQPDNPDIYYNLGNALRELVQLDSAIQAYQTSLRLEPDRAEVYNNLGLCFHEQNRWGQATSHFERALALAPDHLEAHINYGILLFEQNRLPEATDHFEQAIALQPDYPAAHINLSFALLSAGDLRRGFAEYEWRWQYEAFEALLVEQPRWDGSDLTGKTLLLYAELGLGDVLHFIRYAPLIAGRAKRVILDCRPELIRLLSTVPGIDEWVPRGGDRPAFDVYSPLMSLPHLLGDELETIPQRVPYLQVVPSGFELPEREPDRFNIGITWASGVPRNYGHQESYRRYLRSYKSRTAPLALFMQLQNLAGVKLYSLQLGEHQTDIARYGFDREVCDLSPYLQDFADTAAAIAQLDLIISVDTALVHLAGALAHPVWTVLPFAPDWRWMLERQDSPWYPTMRLFRQDHPGDWEGVMARVLWALRDLLRGRN